MSKAQKVAVVGAGIGGLNAAIALIQRGFDVTVYEQADALGEIGAGIQLSPNAARVLMALGLDKEFEAIAFEPNRHVVRNWKSGSIVSATQMKGVFRPQYGAGYFGAHRADLHGVLQRAVPASAIRLNARCIGVTQSAERALILFADGSQAEADVIISPKFLTSGYEMAHTEYKISLGMALGLPAVASPQPSYVEAIECHGGGMVARTPREWIEALTCLADSPERRAAMGALAQQTVRERYATPVVARHYLDVLEHVSDRTA